MEFSSSMQPSHMSLHMWMCLVGKILQTSHASSRRRKSRAFIASSSWPLSLSKPMDAVERPFSLFSTSAHS